MTQSNKILLTEFHALGGSHIGLHACLGHRLGLMSERQFGSDIEAIKDLESNSLQTRSLQISLGLVAVQNFHQN